MKYSSAYWRLPDQEVADAVLAAGPDEQVQRRQPDGVQARVDGVLVDLLGGQPVGDAAPGGVHDLVAAGVVEGDVEHQPVAAGGRGQRLLDRRAGRRRELLHPSEEADLDALLAQLGGLVADRHLEQAEEHLDLLGRAGPVLAAEREQRQGADPAADGVADDRADGLDAGRMALGLVLAGLAGPAPVAVHDDRDVTRQVRVEDVERVGRLGRVARGHDGPVVDVRVEVCASHLDLQDLLFLRETQAIDLGDVPVGRLLERRPAGGGPRRHPPCRRAPPS